MDSELTSFQHTIEKPAPIEFGLARGFAVAGLILMMVQGLTPIVLGLGLFLVGLKFLPTHLERHRLIFSSCGNSHEINLGTWSLFFGFRASMALIGYPSMADYMRTGHLDVAEIDQLHKQLRAPIVPKTFEQPVAQLPAPTTPTEIVPIQTTEVNVEIPVQEPQPSVPQAPEQDVPQPVGAPVSIPAPPEPAPAPLPPPIAPPLAFTWSSFSSDDESLTTSPASTTTGAVARRTSWNESTHPSRYAYARSPAYCCSGNTK